MARKVFIIGGTGFLGYHVCRELVAKGYLVTALSFDDVPAGFLPPEVTVIKGNINELHDEELETMMEGHWGFIFAAGVDDRVVPEGDAREFFYNANVKSVERLMKLARAAGLKKVVILNSYFAYFNRTWPEMRLAERHPYISSRVEQQKLAFELGGKDMPVAVMELPYIVGATPTKGSLWKPLIEYVNSGPTWKFYTAGGTAVASVRNVGLALAEALERTTENSCYQIADVNMSWQEWLQALVKDPDRKLRIITIPRFLAKFAAVLVSFIHKLQGREAGLSMVPFIDLQTRKTFLPIEENVKKLAYNKYDIAEDFKDTVRLYLP